MKSCYLGKGAEEMSFLSLLAFLIMIAVSVQAQHAQYPFDAGATSPITQAPVTAEQHRIDANDLALKTQNPMADLIQFSMQSNIDFNVAPRNGAAYLLRTQPVIPLHLTKEWNVIIRPIIPFYSLNNVAYSGSQSGLGNIQPEIFLTPKPNGPITWGIGPTAIFPTATRRLFGKNVTALGPTAEMHIQTNGWTIGALGFQAWKVGGPDSFNQAYLQPFIDKTFPSATTLSLEGENDYSWLTRQWNISINSGVQQIVRIGILPVNIALLAQYYPENGSSRTAWGMRITITPLIPEYLMH